MVGMSSKKQSKATERLRNNRKQLRDEQNEIIEKLKTPSELGLEPEVTEHTDFIARKTDKTKRKDLVMDRVLGIKKDEEIDKRQKFFKRLFTWLFIIFVVSVLLFTAYNDFSGGSEERDFPEWEDFKLLLTTGWVYLLLAILSLIVNYVAKGLKLAVMCKSMTGKFHLKTTLETGIIGAYYNNITPLSVGGQPFEIHYLSKHGIHGGAATSSPIAAFFLNQICFVILGVISVICFTHNTFNITDKLYNAFPSTFMVMALIGAVCCAVVPSLVILFCLLPKITSKLVHWVMFIGGKMRIVKNPKESTMKIIKTVYQNAQCLKGLAKRPLVFISSVLLSLVEYFASISIAYFTLLAFNFKLDGMVGFTGYIQIAQLFLMLLLAISFIPTPGNSGAADLSFYMLFAIGLPVGFAFPAMLVWRFLSFYSYIIIGFLFATTKKRLDAKQRAKEQLESNTAKSSLPETPNE